MKWLIYLTILFAVMFLSQTMYLNNQENNIEFDIYNFTENTLIWNYTYTEEVQFKLNESYNYDISKIKLKRAKNIIYKTIDWLGYSMFESIKFAIEFGYENPKYNFEYIYKLLIFIIIIVLLIRSFPIIIYLLVLLWILYKKIKKLIINLFVQKSTPQKPTKKPLENGCIKNDPLMNKGE